MVRSRSSENLVPAPELIRMIEGEHLATTTASIDRIKVLLDSASHIDTKNNPQLDTIHIRFMELEALYHNHLEKEFKLIFPVFKSKKLTKGLTKTQLAHQIQLLKKDHAEMKEILAHIRKISDGFQAHPGSSPTLKLSFAEFFRLEQELKTHFFLEEEALFPELIKILNKF